MSDMTFEGFKKLSLSTGGWHECNDWQLAELAWLSRDAEIAALKARLLEAERHWHDISYELRLSRDAYKAISARLAESLGRCHSGSYEELKESSKALAEYYNLLKGEPL